MLSQMQFRLTEVIHGLWLFRWIRR